MSDKSDMVEVVIDSIRVGLMSQQRVVILREVEAERYLAIWIDPSMAEQITYALQGVEVARPMTHDLMKNILRKLDARVVRVEVISLTGEVFYGNIVLESNSYELNIDSRPSDALALAVRTNVPIYVSREVMETAGIIPEEDLDKEELHEEASSEDEILAEDDAEERLSVFEDFLENLDIEDENDDKKEN